MKKLFLLLLYACISFAAFAQTDDVWTKDAKTQLANEALASLNANHPDLSDDQKEAIAICYTNAIISAHPKRSEWANLMEIEVKKEKSNTLNQCLKSGGVGAPKKEEPKGPILSKEFLVGAWKTGEEEYTFAESGTSLYHTGNKNCPGTWVLEARTITINPKGSMWGKLDPCSKTKVFEIISFTDSEITVMDNAEKKKIHLVKEK